MVVQVGLAFIRKEREVEYNWSVEFLCDIMARESIQDPFSIVTDREIALIKLFRHASLPLNTSFAVGMSI
jgi:hypothetical protein